MITTVKPYWVIPDVTAGDSMAYKTSDGWAFSGHRFYEWENGQLVTRESYACGAVRFNRYTCHGWAVIRGTEVLPLTAFDIQAEPAPIEPR